MPFQSMTSFSEEKTTRAQALEMANTEAGLQSVNRTNIQGRAAARESTNAQIRQQNDAAGGPFSNSTASKLGTQLLSYPADVGANDQGHFLIIKILELKPGKVKKSSSGRTNRSLTLSGSSKRVKSQISLYMPPQVSVSYKSNYEEVEIGRTTEAVFDMMRSGDPTISKGLGVVKEGAKTAGMQGATKLMEAVQGAIPGTEGAVEAAQIGVGKVMSEKMEVMFKGVGRRTFSYTFAFIPKSETESQMVDKIVYQLKRAMLPSYVKGGFGGITDEDRTLKIPNTMDIEYFYAPPNSNSTQRNNYLNKIATCYLTDMSVSYGGDRYKAYRPSETIRGAGDGEGTPPQRTSVTLNFTEIEIITQEDVDLGF